jgi:hypothetical protein
MRGVAKVFLKVIPMAVAAQRFSQIVSVDLSTPERQMPPVCDELRKMLAQGWRMGRRASHCKQPHGRMKCTRVNKLRRRKSRGHFFAAAATFWRDNQAV